MKTIKNTCYKIYIYTHQTSNMISSDVLKQIEQNIFPHVYYGTWQEKEKQRFGRQENFYI